MALLKHFGGTLAEHVKPRYTLTYFNARGRAETTRFMFKMTDVDFVDKRIEGTWPQEKKSKVLNIPKYLITPGVFVQFWGTFRNVVSLRSRAGV